MPCNDCSRAEGCPPCVNEPECWCGHPEERHTTSLPEEGREDYCTECDGEDEKHSFSVAREPKGSDGSSTELFAPGAEEYYRKVLGLPPKEAGCAHVGSRDVAGSDVPPRWTRFHCDACGATWTRTGDTDSVVEETPPPPPQPLRRPPYAVAYSVAGHLYEIALPGDATVQATDGGLIITHTLGPVAGVVRVHPIEGEQS